MVGRDRELTALVEAVSRPPAVVLVSGEAGVGKTLLVRELLASRELSRFRRLSGSCHRLREPFPFGPVVDALARAADRPPVRPLPPITGALHPLLPELGHWLPPQPPPAADRRVERHRVFRAVRELLARLGPTVLVVEDVHWMDRGTDELLRFLAADPPAQLGLVVTVRPEDASAAEPVRRLVERLGATTGHAEIRVRPLTVAEVGSMAAAVLGTGEVTAAFAARLHESTGGLPFAVEEVLGLLPDAGAARLLDPARARAAIDALAVPGAVRESQRERLARLGPAARRLVAAAAVLDVPGTAATLGALAGLRPAACADALADAVRHSVLRPVCDDRYGFRHALARQAVYEELPVPQRRRWHAAAERVLRTAEPVPHAQLAHHSWQAGWVRAGVRHAEAAAHRAAELGDFAAATDLLRQALARPGLPRTTRVRLTVQLGRTATLGLAHGEVVPLLTEVLAEEHLPVGLRGELRLGLGLILSNQLGEVAAGAAHIELAVTELRRRPELAARALSALAVPDHTSGPVEENLAALSAALRLLPRITDPVLRTAILVNRASALSCVGDPAAWAAIDALPATATCSAERQQLLRGACNFTINSIQLGHYAMARRFLRRMRELAGDAPGHYTGLLAEQCELHVDWATGRWAGIDERIDRMSATTDVPFVHQDGQMMLGVRALLRGELAEAGDRLRAAHRPAAGDEWVKPDSMTVAWLCWALLAAGRAEQAVAEADRVLRAIRVKGAWAWAVELVPPATRALLAGGDAATAAALVAEFAAGLADRDSPLGVAALAWSRAMLAEAALDHAGAAEHYRTASERYAALPRPYDAALTAEAAGHRLLVADPDGAAGPVLLTAALHGFERLGVGPAVARCRGALRSAGAAVPNRRGRPGYGNDLSPRERQVLGMVRLGHTNRRIADALHVSERTVEGHVARLLGKLGFRTRRDLWTGPLPDLNT